MRQRVTRRVAIGILRRGGVTRRPGERGQALVEFALVSPVLFLILFAIIQLGFLLGGQLGLVNAVRDTARAAATYRVSDAATAGTACTALATQLDRTLSAQLPGYTSSRMTRTATYSWVGSAGNYSVVLTLDVRYRHSLFIPLVGNLLDGADGTSDNTLALTAREVMRIENPPLTTTGGTVTCP